MIFTLGNSSTAKLVLYHAVSSYQLLEVMLHRMIFHKKDRAVLILPDFIVSKYPQYKKLETEKFFHEVYLFPYLFIPHREEDLILKDVTQYYHQMIPYSITDFSNIYVAGAHFYFSLYLIKNQIPFFFFEDAAGIISRSKQLYQILLKKFPVHAKIAQKYGLYEFAVLMGNMDAQWLVRPETMPRVDWRKYKSASRHLDLLEMCIRDSCSGQ